MEERLEGSARNPVWRGVKITLGILLLPLGVVGLFLPFLQGVLFLILGLSLLASEIPYFARLRDRLKSRFSKLKSPGERC
jgi:uncharacterized membrane protein YbaN (DUF454 family)